MNVRLLFLVVVLAHLGAGRVCPAETISNIVIDTDRSINCATLETIVADVCEDCKTERDRAIALYTVRAYEKIRKRIAKKVKKR